MVHAGHVLAVLEPTEAVLTDLGRGDLDTGEALELVEGAVLFLFEFKSKKCIKEDDLRRMKPLLRCSCEIGLDSRST